MRSLKKEKIPKILEENKDIWTQDYLADSTNSTKKFRYRHADIKAVLQKETGDKCIYCECKLGHNTPGETEHMIPSSAVPQKHFEWDNLTRACTECNRRKNAYNHDELPFLNPYTDDVEAMIIHLGPIVNWKTGETRAEISLKTLELNNGKRMQLILRKIEHISDVNNLMERINDTTNPVLKKVLELQLEEMKQKTAEFSGMVKAMST